MPTPIRKSLPMKGDSVPESKTPSIEETRFCAFVHHVQGCKACTRLALRSPVLSELNGPVMPSSGVMFIAEAPGRNGADRTRIPIHGDPTGVNFERLLDSVGWARPSVFVTNCVLCNPRDEAGNNDSPTYREIEMCSFNLEQTIRLVKPRVIATLGVKALDALKFIESHEHELSKCVANPMIWWKHGLFPLYHQSPRALIHRSMQQQEKDFAELKKFANAMSIPF